MKFSIRQMLWLTACVATFLAGWILRDKTVERQIIRPASPCDKFCSSPLSYSDDFFTLDGDAFWDDLEKALSDHRLADAVWLLSLSSPEELIRKRGRSYCADGGPITTCLPGVNREFDPERDFLMPQEPMSGDWSLKCNDFLVAYAMRYNRLVDQIFPPPAEDASEQ